MPEYSLWLIPSIAHEAALAHTIARLSASLGGVRFEPHVTIQGDLDRPREQLAALTQAMAAQTQVQQWPVQQVEAGAHFFRCIYLRFADPPAFAALQQASRASAGTATGLSPYPHLSLVYSEPHADNARSAVLLAGEYGGRCITFDRIALVRSSSSIAIADWQTVATYALTPIDEPSP